MKPLLLAILKEPYADMARMEDVLRASDRDWTIVRPPQLTNKAPSLAPHGFAFASCRIGSRGKRRKVPGRATLGMFHTHW